MHDALVTLEAQPVSEICALTGLDSPHVAMAMDTLRTGRRQMVVATIADGITEASVHEALCTRFDDGPAVHLDFDAPVVCEVDAMLADTHRGRCEPLRTEWLLEHYHGVEPHHREQLAEHLCRASRGSGHGTDFARQRLIDFHRDTVRRAENPGYWVRMCLRDAVAALTDAEPANILVTGLRDRSDIGWLAAFGAQTVRIAGSPSADYDVSLDVLELP